ncbi:hypothetical protein QNH91_24115 [Klebsiella pneumoniae]|uniref:hypothetical protein n=1 Tax=Klebsiella pneumoniae TaxID=573 RepID=UPI0025532814|nr:hypothetical protein [Klebsiella pneumoniae]MDK9476679.1 hypothetical protein [Klebsiella pneumoniae]
MHILCSSNYNVSYVDCICCCLFLFFFVNDPVSPEFYTEKIVSSVRWVEVTEVESDLLIKNKYSTLVNVSEVYYGWGVDKKSKYPVNTSAVFPNEKVCVWNVSFALPESIRKKCDDDGAYGYFIEFKKVNGKTVLYNFTSLFDSLPDGTLACKAANKFMLQK